MVAGILAGRGCELTQRFRDGIIRDCIYFPVSTARAADIFFRSDEQLQRLAPPGQTRQTLR
jgi:hypothetical protein